jgi:hypothetical protein
MDHDRVVLAGGRGDPVGDEVREFLGPGATHVERDTTGRHTPLTHPADGTEVGSAQEAGPDLPPALLLGEAALPDPETGKAVGVRRQMARGAVLGDGEVVRFVEDLARDAVLEGVHPHGLGKELAHELEKDRIGPGPLPNRRTRA